MYFIQLEIITKTKLPLEKRSKHAFPFISYIIKSEATNIFAI